MEQPDEQEEGELVEEGEITNPDDEAVAALEKQKKLVRREERRKDACEGLTTCRNSHSA